jgi:hypothetical protein
LILIYNITIVYFLRLNYMSVTERSGFENAINDYQNRLSNIKSDELQAYAKRIAESDKPLEELKSVLGEITNPLAIDFLKEGIMHHMGVASAQIKKGGAALRKDLEKQFNDRVSALKQKAQGIIDEQRGKLQSALDEARGKAQTALDKAKGQIDEVRGNATEAVANARDQANALNPTNTNPNATNDEQSGDAQQRVPEDEDFEEPEVEPNVPKSIDIDSIEDANDVRAANTALRARYNNLTDEAQQRVTQKYADDDGVVPRGEGEGPNGVRTIDDMKINLGTMQENIEAEEKAGNLRAAGAEPSDLPAGAGGAAGDVGGQGTLTVDPQGDVSALGPSKTPLTEEQVKQLTQGGPAPEQEEVGNTEQAFRDHVDSRVQELRTKLDADPELNVKIAADEGSESTNIGTGLAKGQHADYAEATGEEDVGDKVQKYISDKLDDLKADYPDRVSFGKVGGDIPENELHVWGANSSNVDLPAGTKIPGAGQAEAIGTAGENEFGIVSTPLNGLPGQPQGAVAQRVAQIEQQGDILRPTQQLPTAQAPKAPRPAPAEAEEEPKAPTAEVEDEKSVPKPPTTEEPGAGLGADVEEGAEQGAKVGARAATGLVEGAETGLGEDAAIAASAGAETGGLGFLVAGVLGIAATLGGIFAPHHEPKPPPVGPVAAPTQTVGLR